MVAADEITTRSTTSDGFDAHRERYLTLLDQLATTLDRLDPAERLGRLFDLISPLLDEIAEQNGEFDDEAEMETVDAVRRFRSIAAGEALDADAVHHHLTSYALVESEDQDPEMHARAQAAFLAAGWLRMSVGRALRAQEIISDECRGTAYSSTELVNELAWTRSRQVSILVEYIANEYVSKRDVGAAADALADMLTEVVEARPTLEV